MENDALGAVLGAVLGIMGGGAESVDTLPVDYRPLRLAGVGRLIDLRPADLQDVSLIYQPSPALAITFGPEAASWIASTTTIAVGEMISVSICGDEVMSPVIQTPILDGQVVISGNFSVAELTGYADYLTGHSLCEVTGTIETK